MILKIAKNELKIAWRDQRLRLLLGLVAGLLLLSGWVNHMRYMEEVQERQVASDQARASWDNIGEYNPHGAAHFGQYCFRPVGVLSMLDAGVQPFTGKVLRLEGHVQNELSFSEASLQSSISRLGYFQPAMVLQLIVPLLLIFLGYASVAGERESGLIKISLLQGISLRHIMLGKAFAYWAVVLLFPLLLLLIQLGMMAISSQIRLLV